MRITRFLLLTTLLAIVGSNWTLAQEKLNKSDSSREFYDNVLNDYNNVLKKMLLSEQMTCGYLFLPSFSPEYSIICVSQRGKNLLIYNHPDISIWYDIQDQMWVKDPVPMIIGTPPNTFQGTRMIPSGLRASEAEIHAKISSDTLIIEKSLADSLDRLMQQIVDDAIKEEEKRRIEREENGGAELAVLDGETHVFLYQGKEAKFWSPRIVSLMSSIREAIINKDASQINVGELLNAE
jgi:hypothetical protein